jgi:hypothetical protein
LLNEITKISSPIQHFILPKKILLIYFAITTLIGYGAWLLAKRWSDFNCIQTCDNIDKSKIKNNCNKIGYFAILCHELAIEIFLHLDEESIQKLTSTCRTFSCLLENRAIINQRIKNNRGIYHLLSFWPKQCDQDYKIIQAFKNAMDGAVENHSSDGYLVLNGFDSFINVRQQRPFKIHLKSLEIFCSSLQSKNIKYLKIITASEPEILYNQIITKKIAGYVSLFLSRLKFFFGWTQLGLVADDVNDDVAMILAKHLPRNHFYVLVIRGSFTDLGMRALIPAANQSIIFPITTRQHGCYIYGSNMQINQLPARCGF